MQHLSPEELAGLVEAAEPGGPESLHLEVCGDCRAELEELERQTHALRALPVLPSPPAVWPRLEERLAAEGLIAAPPVPHRGLRLVVFRRIAAALALFLGGGAAGAALGPMASVGPLAVERAATPDAAAEALRAAEADYLAALSRYAELTGTVEAEDPVNRLAALEGIALAAQAALQEAPADPVINGYLLTALGQREAILRRISGPGETWY